MDDATTYKFHTIDKGDCAQFDDGTWTNANEKKFDECRSQAPMKNMHNGKFVRNASKTKPYCVRCKPAIDNTSSVKQLIATLEKVVQSLGGRNRPSADDMHTPERVRAMTVLEKARVQFADQIDAQTPPLGPSYVRVPKRGCLEPADGKSESQLYQFSRSGKEGKFCGSLQDKEVVQSKDYHHLNELDNLRQKKDTAWPVTHTGRKLETYELYDRAAMCSQLRKEEACISDKKGHLPLSLEMGKASELCKWNPDVNDATNRGTCEPDLSNMDGENEALREWHQKFKKQEQRTLSSNGKSNSSIRWNRNT